MKYDFYQTESQVVVTILERGVQREECQVEFTTDSLRLTLSRPSQAPQPLHLSLPHTIDPLKSSFRCTPSKIEVKLQKVEGVRWNSLEKEVGEKVVPRPPPTHMAPTPTLPSASTPTDTPQDSLHTYPSSRGPKNWDKIEKEVMEEEEKEPGEGDAAVNKLFQKIYADSSDEVRKAMVKSFTESKGTCLSTNWDEVKKDTVECKPPDTMEWKKY